MDPNLPHLFTQAEANSLLDELRPWVKQMLAARQALLRLRPDLKPTLEKASQNGGSQLTPQAMAASDRIRRAVHAIQSHGVLVKDVNRGLLDFPSRRSGRLVFLCWQYDEPGVEFWHEVDTGFAGRKPV